MVAKLLFLVPTGLYVAAFLYETYLSFARLDGRSAMKTSYVHATWEVTHTLLIFALIVLFMLHTSTIDKIAEQIFVPALLAGAALAVRSVLYTYLFYARVHKGTDWSDVSFALSHVVSALFLVITAIKASDLLFNAGMPVNEQFLPWFVPGLVFVILICIVPITIIYKIKD